MHDYNGKIALVMSDATARVAGWRRHACGGCMLAVNMYGQTVWPYYYLMPLCPEARQFASRMPRWETIWEPLCQLPGTWELHFSAEAEEWEERAESQACAWEAVELSYPPQKGWR